MSQPEAPSREELLARAEALKARAERLQERVEAVQRAEEAKAGLKYGRVAIAIGGPVVLAVITYMLTNGWGWAVLAFVGGFVLEVLAVAVFVPTPAHQRPGTRAFEARLTAELLERVIDERMRAAAATTEPDERARLAREIAFLRAQLAEQRAVDPNDAAPGKGHIGFTAYEEKS